MCAECKKTNGPERRSNVREKLLAQVPELGGHDTLENAQLALESFFPVKKRKFLDVLLERYYKGTTLAQIGKRLGCTREYVRQCEENAIKIILKAIPHDNMLDEEDDFG